MTIMDEREVCSRLCCSISVLLAWLALSVLPGSVEGVDFDYDPSSPYGPKHWGDLKLEWSQCRDGQLQSPIPINVRRDLEDPCLAKLNINYTLAESILTNTGHTVEVVLPPGAGQFVLDGEVYHLKQFHFHAPSEHVIRHVRFPLEMHLVHQTSDGRVAVIGVPFLHGERNLFLDQFWNELPKVSRVGATIHIGKIDVDLPIGPLYARYKGSLTTPPCTEAVIWTVTLWKWNTVSRSQLRRLKRLHTFKISTNRPLQNVTGRNVRLFLDGYSDRHYIRS